MHHTLTGKKSSHQQNYTFVCKLFGRDILLTRITPKRGSDLFHFHSFTKYPCGSLWPVSCKKFCPSSQCPRFHRCKPLGPDSHIKFLKDSSVARHGLKSFHWNFQLYIWFMWATKKPLLLFIAHLWFMSSNSRSFTDTENLSRFVPEASLPIGKPAAVDKTTPSTPRGLVVNAGISEASKNVGWFHTNWIVWLNYSIYILGEL